MSDFIVVQNESFVAVSPPGAPQFVVRTSGVGPDAVAAAIQAAVTAEAAAAAAIAAVSSLREAPMSLLYNFALTPSQNTAILDAAFRTLCGTQKKTIVVDPSMQGQDYDICPNTPSWNEFGPSSLPAQRAITVNYNDFSIRGGGGTMKMVAPPGGQTPGGKCYAFSTEQNFIIGTVKRFSAAGRFYDHNSFSTSPLLSSNYTFGLCGVDGWDLSNYTGYNSSGARRGATAAIYNCINGVVDYFRIEHLAQGFNMNYVRWNKFNGCSAYHFSELVDVNYSDQDSVYENFSGDNEGFGGGEGQLLDMVGQRIIMRNIQMNHLKGAAGVTAYAKGKQWANYAEAVAKNTEYYEQLNPNPIGVEDIIIENVISVNGDTTAGYPFVAFSNRRTQTTGDPPHRNFESIGGLGDGTGGTIVGVYYNPIPVAKRGTIRNIYGKNASGVAIREGDDLCVDNVVLQDCFGGGQSEYASIRIGQQSNGTDVQAVSSCSGSFTRLKTYGAYHDSILIDAMGEARISDIAAVGWGSHPAVDQPTPRGILGDHFALKNGAVSIEKFTALDTNSIGTAALQWNASGTFTNKVLTDNGGHRFTGTTNVALLGGSYIMARSFKRKLLYKGSLTVGTNATVDIPLYTQDLEARSRWVYGILAFASGFTVAAGASVFFRFRKFRVSGGSDSLIGFTTVSASVARGTTLEPPTTIDMNDPENILVPGEQLVLSATGGSGGGVTIADIEVYSASIEWMNT